MTSLCFAIFASALNLYGLAGDDVNWDLFWGTSEVTQFHSGLFAGYLIVDTVICTFIHPGVLFDKFFLLHHFITITSAIAIAITNICTFIYFIRSLSEISNIFLNLMWLLKFTAGKSSTIYKINGVVFSTSFTMCRIFILPNYYYSLILALLNTHVLPPMYVMSFIPFGIAFDVLNIYWFNLIVKGLLKIFGTSGKESLKD